MSGVIHQLRIEFERQKSEAANAIHRLLSNEADLSRHSFEQLREDQFTLKAAMAKSHDMASSIGAQLRNAESALHSEAVEQRRRLAELHRFADRE